MKNKVVFFPKDGVPKVFTVQRTEDLGLEFKDGVTLINPDLSLVAGVPPELWSLDGDGKVIPKVGAELEHHLANRAMDQALFDKTVAVRDNIYDLVKLPETVMALSDKMEDRFDAHETNCQHRHVVANAKLEVACERIESGMELKKLDIKKLINEIEKKQQKIFVWGLSILALVNLLGVLLINKLLK